jgi:hypothetical protein
MIGPVQALEVILGALIVAAMLVDAFQSVVVPRPSARVATIRIAPYLIRVAWPLWRRIGLRMHPPTRRERVLGTFAPLFLIVLLALWLGGLIIGIGLVFHGLAGQIHPRPSFGAALYFAGSSLLTIGYGDFAATGGAARAIAILSAAFGLGVLASAISLLFSLHQSFQRREREVVILDARAGSPPSGVTLLETHARNDMLDALPGLFGVWEAWSAEVLESHLAFPILAWFRSSHRDESWIGSLGAVLDAATLVTTTLTDVPRGPARMMVRLGSHLVLDLGQHLRIPAVDEGPMVERDEFERACARMAEVGLTLRETEDAWHAFALRRSIYAPQLNALARYWATPPSQWIGDRSSIRRRPVGHRF